MERVMESSPFEKKQNTPEQLSDTQGLPVYGRGMLSRGSIQVNKLYTPWRSEVISELESSEPTTLVVLFPP